MHTGNTPTAMFHLSGQHKGRTEASGMGPSCSQQSGGDSRKLRISWALLRQRQVGHPAYRLLN